MAISRYDRPSQQNVQNTYVPIPYAELYNSLQVKQKEYDFLKDTTQQADNEIMALEAPQFIRTSTDFSPEGIVENPEYSILNQYKEQFAKQKQELLNSGVDFTTPEGKQAVAQYVRAASQFKNQIGNQIQQDSASILEHNKNYDEYLKKGNTYQGNAYYADLNVDKFLKNGSGFQKTSLNPYQERTKIVEERLSPIKSQVMKVVDKNGLVTLKDRNTGVEIGTIQNGKTIWKGVGGERVKGALRGIIDEDLEKGIQNEALSYMEFLQGKQRRQVYNDDGSVKKITYKTKDVNGKPVEITEDANKYYYNKKVDEITNSLLDYATNTFVSSDVTDTQNNKMLPEAYQAGGEKDPNRPDLTRPLFMGEAITNGQQIPDYSKLSSSNESSGIPRDVPTMFGTPISHNDPRLKGWVISHTSNPETYLKEIKQGLNNDKAPALAKEIYRKDLPKIEALVKQREIQKQAFEKAKSGNPVNVHAYWEVSDPYYKQVSEKYKTSIGKRPLSNEALSANDIQQIQQIATNNRQTIQSNLNVPLSNEYQGDKLDKEVVAGAALSGGAVIRDAYGKLLTKEELRSFVTNEDDKVGKSTKPNLVGLINSYQLPVGKQPGGYNVTLGNKNYFIEYSNPKSKKFSEGITTVLGNIYDIDEPATKKVTPPDYIQAGFNQELVDRQINPSSIRNVTFTSNRNDLNIDESDLTMNFIDSKGVNRKISIPMFGENSVTELTKYISPLTGNTRDITSGNLPKAKTPEYDNQEFEE